ncbi:hypothetical protein FRB94_003102 [Tulasnella sp. JGI-2019a]|nr:hypothetical protein FRB93_007899 [Tulasnella sp. JGI-2019a]KAG8986117.1 hypothetical protein FRB94_003102 [Tulasnella sp. JGI-2019a]KAG9027134.1 hypothetical protein FRB95_008103 [Tulasnella sp. JGI-2019a]
MSCGHCETAFHVADTLSTALPHLGCRDCGRKIQLRTINTTQSPVDFASSVDGMIEASVELTITSNGEVADVGTLEADDTTAAKEDECTEVPKQCHHNFLWKPNRHKAVKVKKARGGLSSTTSNTAQYGVLCSSSCGQCGLSE